MKINDEAEMIEGELIAFANELFGQAILIDMTDSETRELVEKTRNNILDIFS